MTDYPGEIYSPRTKSNKYGVEYNESKETIIFAEDIKKLDDEVVAIETELGINPSGEYDSVAAFLQYLLSQIGDGVAAGLIVMWSGLIANIPDGWELCDGGDGRPDLREKFVRGAPTETEPGGTGGSETHTHVVSGSSVVKSINHRHSMSFMSGQETGFCTPCCRTCSYGMSYHHHHSVCGNTAYTNPSHNHTISITSQSCSTLPSYYEVLFLIKT